MLYEVPNHCRRCANPAFDVTTSFWVAVGMRKLLGGSSWLLRLMLVLNVGLNAPAAAAIRVSLICGSRRSAFKSTLCSSAMLTASSTVRRTVAGVVDVDCVAAGVCADVVAARP